jgi:aspartate aminotransferase-like enzyme
VRAVRAAGWTLGTGYGPLKETTLRIGHMGDHTVETVRDALSRLEEATR